MRLTELSEVDLLKLEKKMRRTAVYGHNSVFTWHNDCTYSCGTSLTARHSHQFDRKNMLSHAFMDELQIRLITFKTAKKKYFLKLQLVHSL